MLKNFPRWTPITVLWQKLPLANERTDIVSYWEDLLAKEQNDPNLLTEVGKAYLYEDETGNAGKYFNKALKADAAN